ncbi:MAG: class A beta-lactamase-related serine hydrolase [Candidatus Muirbacterium halophilum]|nr:class A beta-lactamase-related serine hydrolase [Candidatus Muirbacterium halophilum]MCK9476757.1 class A beta-lactamase-related serine hydrolase [Candidatus Muirbacterium halophilum]
MKIKILVLLLAISMFTQVFSENNSFENLIKELEEIPELSLCIIKNNKDIIFEKDSEKLLSVGSSFKLYVLKAITDMVDIRKASWHKTLYIRDNEKSLPAGILQKWPNMSPVTIKTLANLMISISDNTATDILIDYIGRENIQNITPRPKQAILKTSEMFKLKLSENKNLSKNFISSNDKYQLQILDSLAKTPLPDISKVSQWNSPIEINTIEWFFSTKELCRVIFDLKDSDILRINDSGLTTDNWDFVGYKGGSEPGVLNLTYVLKKGNDIYTLSITANNSEKSFDFNKVFKKVSELLNILFIHEVQ